MNRFNISSSAAPQIAVFFVFI